VSASTSSDEAVQARTASGGGSLSRRPSYRNPDPVTVAGVLEHIQVHHDLLCAVLRRGRPTEPKIAPRNPKSAAGRIVLTSPRRDRDAGVGSA